MRKLIVAVILAALAGATLAIAGGGTAGKEATHGLVRASNGGTAAGSSFASASASSSFGPNVIDGIYEGESPAVSGLPILPVVPGPLHTRDNESLQSGGSTNAQDPVVQHRKGTGPISAPIQNFDGICLPFGPPCAQPSSCSCLPPDTEGEVGATQYLQAVNTDFAVYSKTGAVLRTSTPINELWANTNGECKIHNDGDPVALYDQLARRWIISQFIATPSGNAGDDQYGECIAVSTSSDATGSYYLYEFDFGTNVFFDYPKLGVWPDGYYMMANEFPTNSETSSGVGVFAFERSKMLQGQPARVVFFDESQHNPPGGQYIGMLPSDLDGSSLPPSGSPNWFSEVDDPTGVPPTNPGDAGFDMRLWAFHVDWANPANSTFGNNGDPNAKLPVAPFARPQCTYGYGDCAPQKGGPQELDVLGDRLMFRMPYRNFGSYASLLLNHSVHLTDTAGAGRIGIRWYEVRIPRGGMPSLYQQGTYAPDDTTTDPLWRWMGSIAQDRNGDIALGYSASGPNDFPSVRYTGRAAGDPLGQMTQAEQTAYTGTGPQTEVEGRWGDYSDMTVDPSDDCTFWYTQEYLATDTVLLGTWRTRIVSFKFPGCRG
ncbi:MAG TPA: hypothetical protein VI142_02725 [Gaiellaceae bacterium]